MTSEQEALARATVKFVREEIAKVQPGSHRIEFPGPEVSVVNRVDVPTVTVTNEVAVPGVTNNLDLSPLAEAVSRMEAAVVSAVEAMSARIAELIAVLSRQAPVTFNPTIHPSEVAVAAPAVTVQSPAPAKRRIRVRHGDGTESLITEE